jgi:hypothetical protein
LISASDKNGSAFPDTGTVKKAVIPGKNQKMNIFWFLPGIHWGRKTL